MDFTSPEKVKHNFLNLGVGQAIPLPMPPSTPPPRLWLVIMSLCYLEKTEAGLQFVKAAFEGTRTSATKHLWKKETSNDISVAYGRILGLKCFSLSLLIIQVLF